MPEISNTDFEAAVEALEQSRSIQDQIFNLNDLCFTKCNTEITGNSTFDTKVRQCMINCVKRYFDTFEMVGKTFKEENQ